MVDDAAGRADDDVHAAAQRGELDAVALAAVDRGQGAVGLEVRALALAVTRKLVGDFRIAMRGMNLEITGVSRVTLATVHIGASLADRDAANDGAVSLNDANLPACTLEPAERDQVATGHHVGLDA